MSTLRSRASHSRPLRSVAAVKKGIRSSSKKQTDSPRSLRRTLGIFDAIARSPDGLSLAELSEQLQSPKSSLLTLLRPLTMGNYLIHANSHYTFGNESFALATNIISARKFGTVVRSVMIELQKRCPETVILAIADRAAETVIYTDVLESPQLVRYTVAAGTARPLYTSAAGQLLLAYQNEKWRDRYLRKVKLKPMTKRTIVDVSLLRRKLDTIRKTGLSVSISEAIEDASGVAAPIFDSEGTILAALLLGGPTARYVQDREKWNALVAEFAAQASRMVGFVDRPGPGRKPRFSATLKGGRGRAGRHGGARNLIYV